MKFKVLWWRHKKKYGKNKRGEDPTFIKNKTKKKHEKKMYETLYFIINLLNGQIAVLNGVKISFKVYFSLINALSSKTSLELLGPTNSKDIEFKKKGIFYTNSTISRLWFFLGQVEPIFNTEWFSRTHSEFLRSFPLNHEHTCIHNKCYTNVEESYVDKL